jgi:hypothetical protein
VGWRGFNLGPHAVRELGVLPDDCCCASAGDASTVQDACRKGTCVGVRDLCANVTCQARNDCTNTGICNPQSGSCIEITLPDDTVCGADRQGSCVNGECQASHDGCQNTSCPEPSSACQTSICMQGDCSFANKSDGVVCSLSLIGASLGLCTGGRCVAPTDKCENVTCPQLSDCFQQSQCDALSGVCSAVPLPAATACNDGKVCSLFLGES